jgi:hypothetical protein
VKYVYRPAAADDIDRAYARYEEERRGLGEEFLAEVTATAKLVLERPTAYPVVVRQTRAAPSFIGSRMGCSIESSATRRLRGVLPHKPEILHCGRGAAEEEVDSYIEYKKDRRNLRPHGSPGAP